MTAHPTPNGLPTSRKIASQKKIKLTTLIRQIDRDRTGANLSSAIRVFVFNHLHAQIAAVRQPTEADDAR